MKLQKLQSLFLLFWLFLPLVGRAELVDACVAAKNTAIYPQFTQFPPVLKEQIAKYKNDWQLLCNKKSDVTLSKLLQNAQSIATDLLEIFNKLDINSKKTINYLEKINSFIPNIYGDCCEGELINVELESFKLKSHLGNKEDQIFFEHYPINHKLTADWIEPTWDYGGCVLFGQYDWIKHFKLIETTYSQLKQPVYLEYFDRYEKDMLETFLLIKEEKRLTDSLEFCTCNNKSDIKSDLLKINAFFKDSPRYRSYSASINILLEKLKAGKVKLNSEAEKHCSGS